jgi:hypothetical protein
MEVGVTEGVGDGVGVGVDVLVGKGVDVLVCVSGGVAVSVDSAVIEFPVRGSRTGRLHAGNIKQAMNKKRN